MKEIWDPKKMAASITREIQALAVLFHAQVKLGRNPGLPSHPRPPHRALCFAVFYCTVVSGSKIETIRKKACLLTCLKSYLYSH